MDSKYRYAQGFTLIELSIVLVIIGLIVGGVLVGRDIIKAAEIRRIITKLETFKSAVNTFRATYGSIPGDIHNATTFWPTECLDINVNDTCNGNGDGTVGLLILGPNGEPFRFWQHLSLAKLITPITYPPTVGNPLPLPPSDISANAYFSVQNLNMINRPFKLGLNLSGLTGDIAANMTSSGSDVTAALIFGQGVLTGKEAQAIDIKIDDGYGGNIENSGRFFGDTGCITPDGSSGFYCIEGYATACVTGRNYNTTSTEKNCLINYSLE